MTGLSTEEKGRIILSVGKGGGGGWRPLNPVQIGELLQRCVDNGDSVQQLASELKVSGDMIGWFLRLPMLAEDVRSSVDWKRSATSLVFSTAQNIAKLESREEQRRLAELAIAMGLTSKSVIQVLQRMKRANTSVDDAVNDIVKLKPEMVRRHVTIGAITDVDSRNRLKKLGADERVKLLRKILDRVIQGGQTDVRLSDTGFTISSDEPAFKTLTSLKPDFETYINDAISKLLQ